MGKNKQILKFKWDFIQLFQNNRTLKRKTRNNFKMQTRSEICDTEQEGEECSDIYQHRCFQEPSEFSGHLQ